jgi:hypothetical protein
VDPIVLVIVIVVVTPVAVIWALAKSAAWRGPPPRPEGRRPVGSLVTEAIPEEHPDDDEDVSGLPDFRLDAEDDLPANGGRRPSSGG